MSNISNITDYGYLLIISLWDNEAPDVLEPTGTETSAGTSQ